MTAPSTDAGDAAAASGRVLDPRGPRFSAALTTVVLAVALGAENSYVLAFQVLVFAWGVLLGPARSPYGLLFAKVVRPRLGPPKAPPEPEAPPRFAQGVGLVFGAVALILLLAGATLPGAIVLALALLAAFVNAAFGLCIGCEAYLVLRRVFPRAPRSP